MRQMGRSEPAGQSNGQKLTGGILQPLIATSFPAQHLYSCGYQLDSKKIFLGLFGFFQHKNL